MLTEPMTLYKLMNLYMLKQVNFPLTNAQLTNFFTEHEYTTYFTLQQALNELEDAGLVHKEASHNSTRYDITREGEETLKLPSLRTWTSTSRRTSSASGRRWEQRPTSTRGLIRTTLSTVKSAKIRRPLSGWIYPSLTGSRQKPCVKKKKKKARYLENKKPGNLCPRHAVTFILTCCAGVSHGVSSRRYVSWRSIHRKAFH